MDISVLLLAPDPDDAHRIRQALSLERGTCFHVQWVSRIPEYPGKLVNGATDVVLLDLLLPDMGGVAPLDHLLAVAPGIPVLVLSGAGDESRAREAMQRGAQDYLPWIHLDSYSLPRALRNVMERKAAADALFLERERAQVTLDSIADGVMSTDLAGNVTYLNSVAESLTGWSREEASGRALGEVFRIVDGVTHELRTGSPMAFAIEKNRPVGLEANSVLVRRDGSETAIEDSAAPIHGRDGSVIGAVMVFHDVHESRAVTARMSHLAQHDFLTDLPNTVLLNDRIAQAIALTRRHKRQFAVLFLDLDRFKRVNDTLGHAAGDKVLQTTALHLQASVRSSDTVSRISGDEFVVLLSEIAHPDDAARSADKIIGSLMAAHQFPGAKLAVTVSIGISIYPLDGEDAKTLLKCADAAMYQAKESGRNQYRFFSHAPNPVGLKAVRQKNRGETRR